MAARNILDIFRGTPYIQSDFRVTRPIKLGDRWQINPFAEFFNLFNRNNSGANYRGINLLPVPQDEAPNSNGRLTSLTSARTRPAHRRRLSPASNSSEIPAHWEISLAPALRSEFPSPRNSECE